MARIHKLDDFTINQIAAGEVVERPASAVKELVENAIDAGSTAITIEIEEGGTSLIRITDNGSGMDPSDALVSLERHATSKIDKPADLSRILTLGFRGEALASIAAVSQMEMFTRFQGEISGIHIVNHGGEIISTRETGCPEGTTLIVRNLFFNTPARLKFLKSNRSETAAVSDLSARLIMAHPEISFKYISQGKTVYHSPGNGSLLSAILSIYGRDVRNALIPIDHGTMEDVLRISGHIGNSSLSRTNRNHQSFFVNGRYVKSPLISACLEEAYKTRMMINHFPWAVLHMEIPPEQIDVNVHPSKTEIRFHKEGAVRQQLMDWFAKTITGTAHIPSASENEPQEASYRPGPVPVHQPAQSGISGYKRTHHTGDKQLDEVQQMDLFKKRVSQAAGENQLSPLDGHTAVQEGGAVPPVVYIRSEEPQEKNPSDAGMKGENNDHTIDALEALPMQVIGTAFSTYILVEGEGMLYILDQHAAHERFLYEKLKEMVEKRTIASQQLLPPFVLEVTHSEYISITDNIALFHQLGFEIEPFGGKAFLVRGIPVVLKEVSVPAFFHDLLDSTDLKADTTTADLQQEDIILMSCKMAVKANDKLSDREITGLLRDIKEKKIPLTCPHGRPILISMSRYELEKKFKRV